jgi:murein DD-endopeptidase MepM/ murein hydrolase activator NlpD
VDRRSQLSLLVVRGDGSRVLRVTLGRRGLALTAVLATATILGAGVLLGDLAGGGGGARALAGRLAEREAALASVGRRVAELRSEMAGWRDLHARIWEPFGPEAPGVGSRGIGGRAPLPEARPAEPGPLGDLDRLEETVRQEGASLRALERLMGRAGKALASLPSRWPVRGPVNSEFGRRTGPFGAAEVHAGIDIGAPRGTPVRAPAAGTVLFAGSQADYGVSVILDHGQDIRTVYAHLTRTAVKAGQAVERGALLGTTGNTGRSSGPHLHYEILVRGQPVNPRAFFWD